MWILHGHRFNGVRKKSLLCMISLSFLHLTYFEHDLDPRLKWCLKIWSWLCVHPIFLFKSLIKLLVLESPLIVRTLQTSKILTTQIYFLVMTFDCRKVLNLEWKSMHASHQVHLHLLDEIVGGPLQLVQWATLRFLKFLHSWAYWIFKYVVNQSPKLTMGPRCLHGCNIKHGI